MRAGNFYMATYQLIALNVLKVHIVILDPQIALFVALAFINRCHTLENVLLAQRGLIVKLGANILPRAKKGITIIIQGPLLVHLAALDFIKIKQTRRFVKIVTLVIIVDRL